MKIKILKITSVIFLLTFLSYACSENNEEFTKIKFDLTFENMELIPNKINIKENSELNLNITSDINGKLHIHGYNIEGEISKNKISNITIKLNATGNFPIAFHPESNHDDHQHHETEKTTHEETSVGNLIVRPK